MDASELIYPRHLSVWRQILVSWLGWSEERFSIWVESWERKVRDNVHGWRDWFYHEDELYFVLPLLVPKDLREHLAKQRTQEMYSDLAELLQEIKVAITGRPNHPTWRTEAFDWEAAKQRVAAVLSGFGARLPRPDEEGA